MPDDRALWNRALMYQVRDLMGVGCPVALDIDRHMTGLIRAS
jgi:hypothetical protein